MAIPAAKPVHEPDALLTERALASRWKMSVRSLQRWRSSGTGPVWMRIGGCIRYRFEDILAFEQSCRVPEGTP